jgi:hypothetical protein
MRRLVLSLALLLASVTFLPAADVRLNWNPTTDIGPSGLANYNIYRDGIKIGTSTTTSFVDSSAIPGTQYRYTISAVDHAGNESAQSAPFVITTSGINPVEKPGPWLPLYNSPFYSCVRNFFVNLSIGHDDYTSTQAQNSVTPWETLPRANDPGLVAGDCINVAPGTYTQGVDIAHGGNAASSTGYVVWRCQVMNGCKITDPFRAFAIEGAPAAAAYIVIDGFELAASGEWQYGQGVRIWDGGGDDDFATHHIWILNNIIHGYGQSGVQINDGEFFYVIHNTTYGNGRVTQDARGSGISSLGAKVLAGYTPVADDMTNPSPLLASFVDDASFFRNSFSWNVTYINNCGGCISDGNGIIFDTFSTYPYKSLGSFNVIYNNGGAGIDVFASDHVTLANNSVYNNMLDTVNTGTYRPGLGEHSTVAGDTVMINNISFGIIGAGILANNSAYCISAGTALNNLAFGSANGGCNASAFPCASNKCNTNPSWVDVGNVSAGNMDTAPNGANFALQAGSPAIGYGLTKTFLSNQSVDAGACHHTLPTCP